ncbi:MFS transporter [Kocuria palustris]|uniref:MFS transporter n=1 Tax=Kocuria palustris TaxID=71999 RepID=UPI0011AB0E50|nr:MFS transporter [Kocuria palustris]
MSHTPGADSAAPPPQDAERSPDQRREERKVLAGTMVGTTIEWYDFFIYAQAAALILGPLFFEPLGTTGAQIASWLSLGISFLVRPIGAIVAGHVGDRYGRKVVLVMTLVGMGAATVLIGLLPTYAQIGAAAPILLVLLRLVQGFSAGGEWGGAALMSVEHAPSHRRGWFSGFPQIGVPAGMVLASLMTFGLSTVISEEAYFSWGWRVPFLISFVLILIGHIIRSTVQESPVYTEMQKLKKDASAPLSTLFRCHWRTVLQAALIFAGNNAAGYLVISYLSRYGTTHLGMERTDTLIASLVGGILWLVFTLWGARITDRIGRVLTFQLGYVLLILWAVPMWFLLDTGALPVFILAIVVLTLALGPTQGALPALFAEMFPAGVRLSGLSIGYALGSVIGGAFAPLIADLILGSTGQGWPIGLYIAGVSLISLIAVSLVPRSLQGRDLQAERADESPLHDG